MRKLLKTITGICLAFTAIVVIGLTVSPRFRVFADNVATYLQNGVPASNVALSASKGRILAADGTQYQELAIGANGTVLILDSTQTLGTKWATVPANGVLPQTINAQSGTTYTFVAGDAQEIVTGSNAGATTFSLPTNATTAFAVNTQIVVIQTGAGAITINAVTPGTTTVSSAGATSASPILNSQYAACVCLKTATDTWIVFGNIK